MFPITLAKQNILHCEETRGHGDTEHPGVHDAREAAGRAADAPEIGGWVGAAVELGAFRAFFVLFIDNAVAVDVAGEVRGVVHPVTYSKVVVGFFVPAKGRGAEKK